MKRCLPSVLLFLVPWLIVLAVPELRVLLRVQTLGSAMMYPQYPWAERFESDTTSPQRIAEMNPDNLNAQVLGLEAQPDSRAREKQLDRLIQQYPQETWLIADRLRNTSSWFNDDRLAGDLENPRVPPYLTPSPEKAKEPVSFTRSELGQAIAMARRGRQLEPDNSYYDWMLAWFLYADYRDGEAMKILHEGSLKPRYDDHCTDNVKATLAGREMVRPLLAEEKIGISSAIILPMYAKFRHLARLASWEAHKAERAGNHAKALQIRSDVARLCAPMMQGRNYLITGMVAAACQAIAWSGPTRRIPKAQMRLISQGSDRGAQYRLYAQKFGAYAIAHQRADLAQEATQLGEVTARFQRISTAAISTTNIYGISGSLLSRILAFWWLSLTTLGQLVGCALLWMALGLILWRTESAPVRQRDLWNSLAFCAVMASVLSIGIVLVGAKLNIGYAELLSTDAVSAPGSPALTGITLGLFMLCPIMCGALICAGVTIFRRWRSGFNLETKPAAEYEGISAQHISRTMFPFIATFCTWSLLLFTLFCWMAALVAWLTHATLWTVPLPPLPESMWPSFSDPAHVLAITASVFSVLCYFGWLAKWRWFTAPQHRSSTHYALRWYRTIVGVWLIFGSFGYFFISLASLPARHEADAKFASYIRQGEIATLTSTIDRK